MAPVARVWSVSSATRVGPRASVLTICLRHHHQPTPRDVVHILAMSAHSRPSHYNMKPTFYPLLVILFFLFRECTANHTLPPNHPPPILFLASTLFLVPSYTWDGGGRRFVILKKCEVADPAVASCYCFYTPTTRSNCFLNAKIAPPLFPHPNIRV